MRDSLSLVVVPSLLHGGQRLRGGTQCGDVPLATAVEGGRDVGREGQGCQGRETREKPKKEEGSR